MSNDSSNSSSSVGGGGGSGIPCYRIILLHHPPLKRPSSSRYWINFLLSFCNTLFFSSITTTNFSNALLFDISFVGNFVRQQLHGLAGGDIDRLSGFCRSNQINLVLNGHTHHPFLGYLPAPSTSGTSRSHGGTLL